MPQPLKRPSSENLLLSNSVNYLEAELSNTPHTLAEEFPGQMDRIHELKVSDAHFARLLKEYDEVNDKVHLAETNVDPVEQLTEVELRKRRLNLKDQISAYLAKA